MVRFSIVVILLTVLTTSCSIFRPKPVVIRKVDTKLLKVPDVLLEPLKPVRVPNPREYTKLPEAKRTKILTSTMIKLLKNVGEANRRLEAIKRWNIESEKMIDRINKDD